MANRVFCIGVWDMFHAGHLSLLQQAAELGELTVGVVMDEAVKRQKGQNRPVISQRSRYDIISALKCVHWACFVEDFRIPNEVIEKWDIIVLGEDQHHIEGFIPLQKRHIIKRPKDGNCTSEIIKKIKES